MHIGVSPNGSSTQYRMLLCTHTHVTDDVPYYDCTRTLLIHAQDTYIFIADRCWIHSISPPLNRGKKKTNPERKNNKNNKKGEQTTNKNKNQGEEHKRNKNKKGEQTRRTRTREDVEGDVIWEFLLCTYPKKENSAGRWVPCLLSMLLCM